MFRKIDHNAFTCSMELHECGFSELEEIIQFLIDDNLPQEITVNLFGSSFHFSTQRDRLFFVKGLITAKRVGIVNL